MFAAVDPEKDALIGEDGLHPTVEGYAVIARTFFAAITEALTVTPDASTQRSATAGVR